MFDTRAVRATLCNPQHFFATADAARDWQSRYPGMQIVPVAEAYTSIMRSIAEAMLGNNNPHDCC